MISIRETVVTGIESAIRGMRNPKNSWDKSDSVRTSKDVADCEKCAYDDLCYFCDLPYTLGVNDIKLASSLAKGGPVHAKYRRMIVVYADIVAPLYWWKEYDTYKVGTVANSCSTMHKIHAKEFTLADFSVEHLNPVSMELMEQVVDRLNTCRKIFLACDDKEDWWQMIQLLPSSYNQKRTVMLNYEVLHNIYISRKNHKLDEWREFCEWIKKLPYSYLITEEFNNGAH